jgi:N-carbamoylputrescine amidase
MPDSATDTARIRIALAQMRVQPDPAANLQSALRLLEQAAAQGAQLVCLPELFRTPYFCQTQDSANFALAEPMPSPTIDAIAAAARRHTLVVICPVFERRAPGVYHNTAVVLDADGTHCGIYRKLHIPDDPHFCEKFYFTPGDLGVQVFDARVGRIAVLICWDQWFPEAARLAALQGAFVTFYPTAIGWLSAEKAQHGATQRDAWRTVQRGHAIANGMYVAAVNRVGFEPAPDGRDGIEFWGSSFVADPLGTLIADAPDNADTLLCADISPLLVERVRQEWPFLRDRRGDAYTALTRTLF